MLFEVVGLKELDALLGHFLAELLTHVVLLVSDEHQINHSAGAVFLVVD